VWVPLVLIAEAEGEAADDLGEVRVDANGVVAGVDAAELHQQHVDRRRKRHNVNSLARRPS
jgi:hypothetical protein